MAIQHGQYGRNRRTLSSWWRGAPSAADRRAGDLCDSRDNSAVEATATGGVLVPFPIHGEALLVKLAEALRNRVVDTRSGRDPLLLKISRHHLGSRLALDQTAYVEFHSDQATYHMVIEAASDTKLTLDTTDFDTLVKFVTQYVTERPAEPATLEAVS
jgi:hypothetical protein